MCKGTQELISAHAVKNYSSKDGMTYAINGSYTYSFVVKRTVRCTPLVSTRTRTSNGLTPRPPESLFPYTQ